MDADGSSKKGPPGRRTRKKLKFKPKVPPQKPRKSVPEKPNLEQSKPIDEELMKRLKKKPFHITRAVPLDAIPGNFLKASLAPLLWIIAQYIPQESHKNLFSGLLYDDEDDDDDDDDEGDNNVELEEIRPSSTECESSIHPAEELNLLEQGDTRRMLLFQLPKSLPLPRISAAVERNGKARDKEVKEGSNLKELPQGYLGKMVVYKSGKIKMKLGDVMFDVNPGEECRMAQHVAAINTKEKHCCLLGEIESRHVVVTPDVDSLLLNDNRDLTKAFIEMSFPTGLPKRHVAQGPGRYTHTRPYDGPIKAAGTSTGLTQAMVPLLKPPLKPCPSMKTGGFFFIFNFF
uniref:DNA-directed RNA polymerase III subunit RPC4 n=1 Tax=Oryza rufipogon TaxID=4529 RepID=A0A0E0N622_ORYRU